MASTPAGPKLFTIMSYVPQMVISHYLDNPGLESPAEAKPESFPAAVLFVDISGLFGTLCFYVSDGRRFCLIAQKYRNWRCQELVL